ncbi:glycine-rich protein [Streptomyces collinus]|uniref:glycine-rich protein n=1 Tax=Streptomyces collinus TaxID=42684 RepID=UPI0036446732
MGGRGRVLAAAVGVLCAAGLTPVALGTAHAQGTCTASGNTTTCSFAFTGAEQTFTVPNGVTQVDVTAIGAAGGKEGVNNTPGGRAAQVSGALTGLSAGQTLYVEVGGTPTLDTSACYGFSPCIGGFNGGGTTRFGGGGGGASDVRTQPRTTTDSRLVVAAGGGGAGEVFSSSCPGSQGGDAGQPGADGTCNGGNGGGAGTATQGGAAARTARPARSAPAAPARAAPAVTTVVAAVPASTA